MPEYRFIDGVAYFSDAHVLKAMAAERQNAMIAGLIIGFIVGVAVVLLFRI